MARTYRTPEDRRKKWHQKESKVARKQTVRQARQATKQALRDYSDLFPQYRSTQGRLTY